MDYAPSDYICLEGEADVKGENYSQKIGKGDYFFLPYVAEGKFSVEGNAVLIECLPSKQDWFKTSNLNLSFLLWDCNNVWFVKVQYYWL